MKMQGETQARDIHAIERPQVPWLSVVLGYGPMLPIVLGGVTVWFTSGLLRDELIELTAIWAITIVAFFAGVRRGLSFRTEGGPRIAQIATMMVLFILALVGFVLIAHGLLIGAVACALIAYASVLVLDPIAARDGEAPLFFERLRPPQMSLAVLGLVALFANLWFRD